MPIPYRDADGLNDLGAAAYLKIQPWSDGSGYQAALFLINARGEPLEFTYNRIETPHTFLWRQDDVLRHSARRLATSLLSLCPITPRLILCLADEVGSDLFCRDIRVSVPVCRIASAIKPASYSADEAMDTIQTSEPVNLFWFPGKPQDDSVELRLLHELTDRGLLAEPFARAAVGLCEVYGPKTGDST